MRAKTKRERQRLNRDIESGERQTDREKKKKRGVPLKSC